MPKIPADAAAVLTEIDRRRSLRQIETYYPDDGPLARAQYTKHLEFFAAGASHRERMFIAANQSGKSLAGCYETACHLTGIYPAWWTGRRFERPVRAWICGDYGKTVRDTLQRKLLGPPDAPGTGLVRGELIERIVRAAGGVADSVDTVYVRHTSGQMSAATFKSYEAGRLAFQGDVIDVLHLDEEPDYDIYTEALTRTATKPDAAVMLTFTPLRGMSDVVIAFLPDGPISPQGEISPSRYVVTAGWDDVPHLSAQAKADLLASYRPHEREARSKGVPMLGEGAIYATLPEELVFCEPFAVPVHWPRCYGLDVGWNQTAAVWLAWDRDTDNVYQTNEYYPSRLDPGIVSTRVHAAAIKNLGEWLPGVIDPAARGRSQKDGLTLLGEYLDLGLRLEPALNAREAGIFACYQRMESGRLKIFRTCTQTQREWRLYHRSKGLVVKKDDHAMDALRYAIISGLEQARTKPLPAKESEWAGIGHNQGWMA